MRCFLLVHAVFGGVPPAPVTPVYINRDLITVVAPAQAIKGSEYLGAGAHLSFNASTYRYVTETPEQIMRSPCVTGTKGEASD